MYNTNFSSALSNQKILGTGNRIIETFTLFVKSAFYKKIEDNEALSYFLHLIKKGSIIIDIGSHDDDYLYFLLKMEKHAEKLIAFESDPETYEYLSQKKEILKLKNVVMEQLSFQKETEKELSGFSPHKTNGTTVIDFKTGKNQYENRTVDITMLDKYCEVYEIKPDVLFIQGKGNKLTILNGAAEVLKKYKPKILLECHERHAGRKNILEAFKYFDSLKYSGYFILDSMKIPQINFDFNIYQNPLSNFYCKYFIFE